MFFSNPDFKMLLAEIKKKTHTYTMKVLSSLLSTQSCQHKIYSLTLNHLFYFPKKEKEKKRKQANCNLNVYTFHNFHQNTTIFLLNAAFLPTDSFVYEKLNAERTAIDSKGLDFVLQTDQ
jgi:hypothetical protein